MFFRSDYLFYLHFFYRNNSIKELDAFAENAVSVNRLIMRHISMSEAFNPPTFKPWSEDEEEDGEDVSSPSQFPPIFAMPGSPEDPMFKIGMESDNSLSSEEEPDQAPVLWMGLSPPGESGLARRRAIKTQDNEDNDSNMPSPRHCRSPPKFSSAMF